MEGISTVISETIAEATTYEPISPAESTSTVNYDPALTFEEMARTKRTLPRALHKIFIKEGFTDVYQECSPESSIETTLDGSTHSNLHSAKST